jgi:hypothetical protein
MYIGSKNRATSPVKVGICDTNIQEIVTSKHIVVLLYGIYSVYYY